MSGATRPMRVSFISGRLGTFRYSACRHIAVLKPPFLPSPVRRQWPRPVEVRSRRDLPPYIILRRPAVRVAAWQGLSLPKAVTRRSLCPVTPLRYLLYHPS